MAYRVNPDGSIECATAQEALNLQALIQQRLHGLGNGNGVVAANEVREERYELPDLGRMFLRELLARPRQTATEVARRIDSRTSAFPPMYRGIYRWAKSAGLDPETLIVRSEGPEGDRLSVNDHARNIVENAVRT